MGLAPRAAPTPASPFAGPASAQTRAAASLAAPAQRALEEALSHESRTTSPYAGGEAAAAAAVFAALRGTLSADSFASAQTAEAPPLPPPALAPASAPPAPPAPPPLPGGVLRATPVSAPGAFAPERSSAGVPLALGLPGAVPPPPLGAAEAAQLDAALACLDGLDDDFFLALADPGVGVVGGGGGLLAAAPLEAPPGAGLARRGSSLDVEALMRAFAGEPWPPAAADAPPLPAPLPSRLVALRAPPASAVAPIHGLLLPPPAPRDDGDGGDGGDEDWAPRRARGRRAPRTADAAALRAGDEALPLPKRRRAAPAGPLPPAAATFALPPAGGPPGAPPAPTPARLAFCKTLTRSDAGALGRVILPAATALRHFPPFGAADAQAVAAWAPRAGEGGTAAAFSLRYKWWNNSRGLKRMYLLDGAGPLLAALGARAGAVLAFYVAGDGRLVVVRA